MKDMTRRQFGKATVASAAATLAGASLPKVAFSQPQAGSLRFPKGFVWGCSTSAYQSEGAVKEDGRGPSIWDIFSHTPGKTFHGQTGDVTDDSYHLYKEDVRMLRNLGVSAYHMSIAWPRIFPNGTGQPNPKGMDYYNRVVDELLANNITPYIDLYVWDLPQALESRWGGWQSRETAKALAEYAGYVTKRLSDRVHYFAPINEPDSFTNLGYGTGIHAPGLKLPAAALNQVRHNAMLGHGLGVQAIRANAPSGTQVGFVGDLWTGVPVIETQEHIAAARRATREENGPFLTAVMEGKYPDGYLEREGANAPKIEPGDMEIIGSPVDFVGVNIYAPEYVRADSSPQGYTIEPVQADYPRMVLQWELLGPEITYWAVRNIFDLWKPSAIYITENGAAAHDVITPAGRVEDTERVMYLRNHLTHLHRATTEGYPVKGYFIWSLLDNFEWAEGYSARFGLYYVDYKTLKRIPKLSAEWFRELTARNAVA